MGSVGLVALLVLAGAACNDDGADRGTGATSTAPIVTTPPRPDVLAQLKDPSVPVVDLPPPPFEGAPQVIGSDDGDLVAFGGQVDRYEMNFRPTNDVAVLDDETLSWTMLPPAPFDDPLIWPEGIVADGQLLVSGPRCEGDEPVNTTGPSCHPGPAQTARLDLTGRRWQVLPDPTAPDRLQVIRLFATESGVLAMASSNAFRVGAGEVVWSFLPSREDQWRSVDGPPIPITMVCAFETTLAVTSEQQSSDGQEWTVADGDVQMLSDRFRNVRAVFWDDDTGSWGEPTAEAVTEPIDLMGGACTREGLAWTAMLDPWGRPGGAPLAPAGQGLYLARPGSSSWERRPFDPPEAVGPSRSPYDPLPAMADPTSIVLPSLIAGSRRVLDIESGIWRPWIDPDLMSDGLIDVSFAGRPIVWTDGSDRLAAIRNP